MAEDDIKSNPWFKSMLSRLDSIEEDYSKHLSEYNELWKSKDGIIIGRLLKCHLLLEHYIDKYLKIAYPLMTNLNKIQLTSFQKIMLANNSKSNLFLWFDGIIVINKIRNRFAHRLNGAFDEKELKPLTPFIKERSKRFGIPMPHGIELIESFTDLACGAINASIMDIKRYGFGKGLDGYHEWLKSEIKKFSE